MASNKRTIVGDITFGSLAVVISLVVLFGFLSYFISVNNIKSDIGERSNLIEESVSSKLSLPMWTLDKKTIQSYALEEKSTNNLEYIIITDNYGDLIFESGNLSPNLVYLNRAVEYSGEKVGFVRLGLSSESLSVARNSIILSTMLSIGVIIISLYLILKYLIRKIVKKPLQKLQTGVSNVAQGKYDSPLPLFKHQEINDIATNFNLMLRKLKISRRKVKDYQNNLELKIKERTKELEESNRKLVELDKMKINFLNVVTHELKTPLTAIIAYLEILQESNEGLNEEQRKSLKTIMRNSGQLNRLIGNILEVARIESGKFELIYQEFSPKEKIEEIRENLTPLCERKNLKLNFKSSNLPEKMTSDEQRFEEVLNNLISNAVKFTEKGAITINAEGRENEIFISVSDTGVGIPKDKLKNLFQDFYQVDSSVSRKFGGTGLGLSITKKIIELQGGKIDVKSTEGKGSVFEFTLPLKPIKEQK